MTITEEIPASPHRTSLARNGRGILVGLIGTDIAASQAPFMHQSEGDAQNLCLVYRLVDLTADPRALGKVLESAALLGFAGVNITHPFKQSVIPLLDKLSDEAAAIGAVNTVIFGKGGWIGHNTDAVGFKDAFNMTIPNADLTHVLQVGAGGAGAATGQIILAQGAGRLTLVDNIMARAEALAERLRRSFTQAEIAVAGSAEEAMSSVTGIINATPVGMHGHQGLPLSAELIRPEMWVFDVVYFPRETELLRTARSRGCVAVNGSGMAVLQAARAFELFTGRTADRDRMLAALPRE